MTTAPDPRSLPRLLAAADPSLTAHFETWGQMPGGGHLLIDEVERAGLRGRGGAEFPTAQKLRAVAAARRTVVVANGTEGEPASVKDKVLLAGAPHLVLDGASIAAETVGASEAIICVDRAATSALTSIRAAVKERTRAGADRVTWRVEGTPSRYVTGEESALVHWINGGEAKPTLVPPRPFERGVAGRPTLVSNVETLAHLALIARFGAEWFRGLGTTDDPGTALVTFSGDVSRPGVHELPFGANLADALRDAGVGAEPTAVLINGYSGVWVSGTKAQTLTFDRASLRQVQASVGCAAISVLGRDACGLVEAAAVTQWLAAQSSGQCGPCANGLPAIAGALDILVSGDRGGRREKLIMRWLDMVEGRGACHHPDGAARFVRSTLRVFGPEVERHRRHGPCNAKRRLPTPKVARSWR